MSSETIEVNITRELNDAITKLNKDLERASKYVTVAEQFSKLSDDVELPDSSLDSFYGSSGAAEDTIAPEPRLDQELRDDFYAYSARYAVLVMVTAFEAFLLRLLWIAKLCRWLRDNRSPMPSIHFFRLGKEARRDARRTSVARLIDLIAEEVNRNADIESLNWFKTIYAARNCLTHRGGVVGPEDVNEDGKLRLIWNKIQILVNGEPRDQIRGLYIEANSQISIRFSIAERELAIGESFVLTSQDCQHIALTIARCADDIKMMLGEAAEEIISTGASEEPAS